MASSTSVTVSFMEWPAHVTCEPTTDHNASKVKDKASKHKRTSPTDVDWGEDPMYWEQRCTLLEATHVQ